MSKTIIYEQPLNEIIRACLRLELLFRQIDHQMSDMSELGSRSTVSLIINVLHLLDRPDLKAKLAKEISQHLSNIMRYSHMPDIDTDKLQKLSLQLDALSRNLIDSSGKIGHRLRDIELLNTLRMHLASPGGGCSFDIPVYHFWLQQPSEVRQTEIAEWLKDFEQIRTAVTLVLDLVRLNAKIEDKVAVHGFHQELLDPRSNLSLIRISIPHDTLAYPEISVGRHFLSVRFYSPSIDKRPVQFVENLPFCLAYCHT